MGQCLSVQEVFNWQRARIRRMAAEATHRHGRPVMPPRSKKRYVTLSVQLASGDVHELRVHLAATYAEVDSNIRIECGMQPHVFAKGRRFFPCMVARHKGVWLPIILNSTVGSVGHRMVNYASTEDIIKYPFGTLTPGWSDEYMFCTPDRRAA